MKKCMLFFLSVFLIMGIYSASIAQDSSIPEGNAFGIDLSQYLGEGVKVSATTTVMSKYKWHGQDQFDDRGAYSIGSTIEIPSIPKLGKVLYIDVNSYFPIGSGAEEATEVDYILRYTRTVREGTRYEAKITLSHSYFDLVKSNSKNDGQEDGVDIEMPNLFEEFNLIPNIYVSKLWDSDFDNDQLSYDGQMYQFGLTYLVKAKDAEIFRIYGDVSYLEGSQNLDNEWGFATIGASTVLELKDGINLTPFINYQINMDGNIDDEKGDFWAGLSIKYAF